MGSNVRESATAKVGELRVVLLRLVGDVVRQVVLHSFLLEPRPLEVVAESAGTGFPGDLGGIGHCPSHGGHVGTGGREDGVELGSVGAVGGSAAGSNTCAAVRVLSIQGMGQGNECTFVTGRLEDTDAAQANKSDQVADSLGVVLGNGLVRLVPTYREGGMWGRTCSSSP